MTTALAELATYLSPPESVEELERMLQDNVDLELYGNVPLENLGSSQYQHLFLGGIYDFLNGELLKEVLPKAMCLGRTGSNATVELYSPSRLLDMEHTFGLSLPQELLQLHQGQARYLPLSELWKQRENIEGDPGEYLVLTLPAENFSVLLHDPQFMLFLQQFQSHVNQQLRGKIKETAEKISRLLSLERGESLNLDYLDVANLPRDFITTYQPRALQEKEKVHYIYRQDGSIRQTLETHFSKAEGKVSLTRIGMSTEEKVELREALSRGQLFYFRDLGQVMIKTYLAAKHDSGARRFPH